MTTTGILSIKRPHFFRRITGLSKHEIFVSFHIWAILFYISGSAAPKNEK